MSACHAMLHGYLGADLAAGVGSSGDSTTHVVRRAVMDTTPGPGGDTISMPALEAQFRRRLEEAIPSATLSVELPFQGNGFLYQVRTTVNGLVFYGRAATEEEAVVKCCKKAIGHIDQQRDKNGNFQRESKII